MAFSVTAEVRQVIATYKNLGLDQVHLTDKLADLHFSATDARDLAQVLNLHFYNDLGMTLDRLIHPSEIEPKHEVSKVVALVTSLHPRPRNNG